MTWRWAAVLIAGLAAGAPAAAQVLPRPPSGATVITPTFEPPYRLTIRVYVTAEGRILAPGKGANLRLTDANGRRIGMDPVSGAFVKEIPNATYARVVNPQPNAPVGPRSKAGSEIALDDPPDGRYVLDVIGTERVAYELAAEVWDRTGRRRWLHFSRGATEPAAVDHYEVTYSATATPPVTLDEKPELSSLTVRVHGAPPDGSQRLVSELVLTDPRGSRLGFDPRARAVHREIPRAYYEEDSSVSAMKELYVAPPPDGTYSLEVIGTRRGRYDFEVHAYDRQGEPGGVAGLEGVPTTRGAAHRYRVEYASAPGRPLRVAGAFGEGARLLSYAHPLAARTELPKGWSSVTLVIFYAAGITPGSFRATLGDADVAARFKPMSGGHEAVTLPLRTGTSTLVLSVEGADESGRASSHTDRLVFVRR